MKTLTTANITLTLSNASVFPGRPVTIEGFATDDAFTVDAIEMGTVKMGVDAKMSISYKPNPTVTTYAIQGDSDSIAFFDAIIAAEKATREACPFEVGTVLYPSIKRKYTLTKGKLTNASAASNAKSELEPRTFQITWESVISAPY